MEIQIQGDHRPTTIKEAVDYLRRTMPAEALAELANMQESQLYTTHFGLAAGVRNEVLRENKALLKDTGHRHPDDASAEIVRALWLVLQASNK